MMDAVKQPIIVMAGGTGGHVFPALAVADYLRDQGEKIVWMGTRSGIESRLVPEAGYPVEWLSVQGLRGKGILTKALAPFKLLHTCIQAMRILKQHRPRAVLGMGGFVSGPGGLMAWLMRIPLIIHEQNAIPGLTNRLLGPLAKISYFAFPQAAQNRARSEVVGNPVRQAILQLEEPGKRYLSRKNQPMQLLVIGGSLGARTLNQVIPEAVALLTEEHRPKLRHQSGKQHLQDCQQAYKQHGVDAEVVEFIDDMQAAYAWADLVICRAGALTVAELSAAGVASILVPFPYAVDDHQYANALFLADNDAALVVRDQQLTAQWLQQKLEYFTEHRSELVQMAEQARAIAYTEATQKVASGVMREGRQ